MSLPIPNLDDKRFEQIVEDVMKLIPIYAPEWTDHNLHDPGITFIELFAWLTEMQIYSLNRIDRKHYQKYLKLLGITPQHATLAKVDVTFSGSGLLSKGCKVIAEDVKTRENVVFELEEDIEVLDINIEKIKTYSNYQAKDVTKFNESHENFFYPFGELPKTGDYFLLGFDGFDKLPAKKLTISFYLHERDLPPLGVHDGEDLVYEYKNDEYDNPYFMIKNGFEELPLFPSAKVKWSYSKEGAANKWEEIKPVKDETIFLSKNGRVSFNIPEEGIQTLLNYPGIENSALFWLKCEVLDGGWEITPRIERILLNTSPAIHGETVTYEILTKDEDAEQKSDGMPYQIFKTKHKPIIYKSLILKVVKESEEADETDNPEKSWSETDDFDSSKPEDKHFKVDYANGAVLFGNGINGTILQKNTKIQAEYRYGGGEAGNIREKAINKVKDNSELMVTNHFPAFGGKEAEIIDEAIVKARNEVRTSYSAVTLNDFEKIAKSTPGLRVARAKAIADDINNAVTVVVVPYGLADNPKPSEGFIKTVCNHIDRHRLITTDISIKGPKYICISVRATIKRKPGFSHDRITDNCIKSLNHFLAPIKRESEVPWPLGRAVYRSEIYEILEDIEGVDGVFKVSMKASGEKGSWYESDGNIVIDKTALVYSGSHYINIIESQVVCRGEKYD